MPEIKLQGSERKRRQRWQSDIVLQKVSFRYMGISDDVLTDINLTLPQGKVTAIVCTSGSGKTTLVKLLLGFY